MSNENLNAKGALEHEQELVAERKHALKTQDAINKCIENEKRLISSRRADILDERKYFIDYFYELHDDERRDLLENEFIDMKTYESTLLRLRGLTKQLNEPYFARFDFKEDGYDNESFYIGTNMVRDPETNRIIVFDWRAPISNMYYECEIGKASYVAPSGKISGDLNLKRRYIFNRGALDKFININMPSDDEFLAEMLSKNAGEHLRSIVETLQKEQNVIIRDYLDGISVIQGCAGSGKTSIALHKIAYIMYTFRNKLQNKEIVILSPNNIFSDYISALLPDLGEENVKQIVQEDIIRELLSDVSVDYLDRMQSIEYELNANDKNVSDVSRFKASAEFLNIIKEYAAYIGKNILKPDILYLDAECYHSVSANEVAELFYNKYSNVHLFDRPEMIADYLINTKRLRTDGIKEYLVDSIFDMFKFTTLETIYNNIFFDKEFYKYLCDKGGFECCTAERDDLSRLSVLPMMWNDVCGMALLGMLISDYGRETNVFYFIADEAQDLTPVFIEILKIKYNSCNMLFAGDNAQLVFGNTGNYVDDIKVAAGYKPFRKYILNTNYRSTKEIADFAMQYLDEAFRSDTSKCIRNGEMPKLINCGNDLISALNKYVAECASKGYESIAILCITQKEADSIRPMIECAESVRLSVLPVYMAKGLEFDCAAVVNCGNRIANADKQNRTNVFYTACTRAMHDLAVFE